MRLSSRLLAAASLPVAALLTLAGVASGSASAAAPARHGTGLRAGAGAELPAICHPGPGLASCYTMTLTTSGAVTVRSDSALPETAPCSRYLSSVAGGGTEVPLPTLAFEDYRGQLSVNLEGWKGPGTYPIETSADEGGARHFAVTFSLGSTSYGALEPKAKPATGSAVVRANGSVTVEFAGLTSYGHPSRTLAGVATYHCQEI
jgi:hypothetical protein